MADNKPDAAPENVVVVRGLSKVFKDFWGRSKAKAVDNVNFEVRRGEVFGLLGPNGSGKSTTIKMLLGLLDPTQGLIQVFGKEPHDVKTKMRIGYLPEESYLYKYLDSGETLDFFGNLFSLSSEERKKRSAQLLDMVGLTRTQNRTVGEFSKGMQRRIGLAQALINDPDLIILDEPTAGMDPIGCREIKDLILTMARRGKTVILSSHLLSDVEDVCDRAVIYYGGKIQAIGSLKDLLSERDTIRITTPALTKERLQEVLAVIGKDVAEDRIRIDNPTQNLEGYFLNIVNQARKTEETSGATSGSQVAEYLRGNGGPVQSSEKMLDRLSVSAPVKEAEVIVTAAVIDTVDHAKLTGLATQQPAAPIVVAPAVAQEDLNVADQKLKGLLGDGGHSKPSN